MKGRPVLIVEDERELAEILGEYLEMEGFETALAFDGEEGLALCREVNPQLVLLDIMLPKIDGVEVCKRIRKESDIPVLMLSAKSGELDKVICLGAGADDYVTKPFSPLELVARVKANLRRYLGGREKEGAFGSGKLSVGKLMLDKEGYTAEYDGVDLDFTTKEFEVLYFFASHPGRVFSKEQIYGQVWGMNEYGDISSVAVYIRRIRAKLSEHHADYIRTVWGAGYKLSVQP